MSTVNPLKLPPPPYWTWVSSALDRDQVEKLKRDHNAVVSANLTLRRHVMLLETQRELSILIPLDERSLQFAAEIGLSSHHLNSYIDTLKAQERRLTAELSSSHEHGRTA